MSSRTARALSSAASVCASPGARAFASGCVFTAFLMAHFSRMLPPAIRLRRAILAFFSRFAHWLRLTQRPQCRAYIAPRQAAASASAVFFARQRDTVRIRWSDIGIDSPEGSFTGLAKMRRAGACACHRSRAPGRVQMKSICRACVSRLPVSVQPRVWRSFDLVTPRSRGSGGIVGLVMPG